jgi:hypothetical protein
MKVIVTASTGAAVVVWREGETYYARKADVASEPQICLGVDLFEVIAELAELDLEHGSQCPEAIRLAADVQRRLAL